MLTPAEPIKWRRVHACSSFERHRHESRAWQLDLVRMANFECIQPTNFFDKLFAMVFMSTMMLVAIPTTCALPNPKSSPLGGGP